MRVHEHLVLTMHSKKASAQLTTNRNSPATPLNRSTPELEYSTLFSRTYIPREAKLHYEHSADASSWYLIASHIGHVIHTYAMSM